MKKLVKTILFGLASTLVFIACSNSKKEKTEKKVETILIQTSKGEVKVPKDIKKVAIFDFGSLDTMDTLGVKVEIATATQSIPKSIEKYKEGALDVGTLQEPNLEKLNEFKPDLIIISGRTEKYYDELSKIAPTIFVGLDAKNYMSDLNKTVTNLGKIFGKETEAANKLKELETEISEIKKETANFDKNILVLSTNDGKISAYGAGSRFGWIFTDLGLKSSDENIKASTHGQEVNFEYISEKNPDIILFDEPMSALDADNRLGLRKELKDIQKKFKTTMIYITHDQEEAFSLSDRVMVMNNGNIEQLDTPNKIFNEPASDYVKKFVTNHLIEKVSSIEKCTGIDL